MKIDCQLFIRTWSRDLDWLRVCLKSVRKYWRSDYPPCIVAAPDCFLPEEVFDLGSEVWYEPAWQDRRRAACWIVHHADRYLTPGAPAALFMDSDNVFTMESCAADFADRAGCPYIFYCPYPRLLDRATPTDREYVEGYRRYVTEVLGQGVPEWEFMQRHPFYFNASTVVAMRQFVENRAGRSMREVMEGWNSFYSSEFNLLGAYAYWFERDQYNFTFAGDEAYPHRVKVFHSWTMTPQSQSKELATILCTES